MSLPLDVSRTIEALLEGAGSISFTCTSRSRRARRAAALRHSWTLNVGTFHSPTERFMSTQVARPLVERLFGRLDGRTATFGATRDLVERFFPGRYEVIRPAPTSPARSIAATARPRSCSRRRRSVALCGSSYVRCASSDRARLDRHRLGARPGAIAAPPQLPQRLRDRVRFASPADGSEAQHLCRAQIAVAASAGAAPAPQLVLRALAAGAVPVASRLPQYEEALEDGDLGLLFEPRDAVTLAGQLARLVSDRSLLATFAERANQARPRARLEPHRGWIRGALQRAGGAPSPTVG